MFNKGTKNKFELLKEFIKSLINNLKKLKEFV
jgi:hypothetical protein